MIQFSCLSRGFMIGMWLASASFAGASEAPEWQERFEGLEPGAIIDQSKTWYLTSGSAEEAAEGFAVVRSPSNENVLSIRQLAGNSRLGMVFRPHTAYEHESNRVRITFQAGPGGVQASLLLSIFGDNGTTQVASLRFDPNGEVALFQERKQRAPEVLPFFWAPGEWNTLEVTAFPEKQEIAISLIGADGTVQNQITRPLQREDTSGAMPWWCLHFSQSAISDTPWFIRSVTLQNSSSPEN